LPILSPKIASNPHETKINYGLNYFNTGIIIFYQD